MEGKIVFDVTFPFEKNTVLMDLFPKEMTFHFKGSMMHSQVKSSYDLLTTDFIINNENKSMTQMLKNMSERYAMELDEAGVEEWRNQYPVVRLEPSNETIEIAGYICNKTTAHFINDSMPSIELYHTKGLGIEASNWWNQFYGVDGFLMGYDIEQYGKRMRLRAREVKFEAISDDKFIRPETFQVINLPEMNQQLLAVVSEFMQ